MTNSLAELVSVPDQSRDQNWENKFFRCLSEANLQLLGPEPQTGPDGWPYLLAETSEAAQEPSQKLIHWLAQRGIGLVVNPQKEYPDYIFSYGMLWSFRETGYFVKHNEVHAEGTVEFASSEIVNAGDPTPQYLPPYVRAILQAFFRDQSIFRPKVLVMSSDNVHYDLAFSLEALGNPPESEHQGIAEAIGWFLPPHYSIMLVSEKGLPDFFDL